MLQIAANLRKLLLDRHTLLFVICFNIFYLLCHLLNLKLELGWSFPSIIDLLLRYNLFHFSLEVILIVSFNIDICHMLDFLSGSLMNEIFTKYWYLLKDVAMEPHFDMDSDVFKTFGLWY